MAEPTTILSAPRSLPAAASFGSMSGLDVRCDTKVVAVKSALRSVDDEEDNNQEDERHQELDSEIHEDLTPQLHRLRNENNTLTQRIAKMETEHAQHLGDLEIKLQHAIKIHNEIEQRLRMQLCTVVRQQQEAVDNARKVRGILTRISTWMRQVQQAVRTQSPSLTHGLEQDLPESFAIHVNSTELIESVPPPAPGRNRFKGEPGKGFNLVGCTASSLLSQPTEVVLKPLNGHSIGLNGPSIMDRDQPAVKRSAGTILAYCAQVVTTSLAGGRSSLSPSQTKLSPAWRFNNLHRGVREENEIDEEAGQWNSQLTTGDQSFKVALPDLSLGLL